MLAVARPALVENSEVQQFWQLPRQQGGRTLGGMQERTVPTKLVPVPPARPPQGHSDDRHSGDGQWVPRRRRRRPSRGSSRAATRQRRRPGATRHAGHPVMTVIPAAVHGHRMRFSARTLTLWGQTTSSGEVRCPQSSCQGLARDATKGQWPPKATAARTSISVTSASGRSTRDRPGPRPGCGDRHAALSEVGVPQRRQFASTGSRLGFERHEREQLEVLLEGGVEEPTHLFGRRRLDLGRVIAAGVRPVRRVVRSPAPHHGLAQRRPHDSVDPGDRRSGQPAPAPSPTLTERRVEAVEVFHPQVAETPLREPTQLPVDDPPGLLDRRQRPVARPSHGPFLDEFADQDFPGADDGIRTRDPNLGKVVLYQLSHVRVWRLP